MCFLRVPHVADLQLTHRKIRFFVTDKNRHILSIDFL